MKHYNIYYLPYVCSKKVNYIFLLYLYGLAEIGGNDDVKSVVFFSSNVDLEKQINNKYLPANSKGQTLISNDTIGKILNNDLYKPFFDVETDGKDKMIILHNNFKGVKNVPFVRLIPDIYNFLIDQKDKLLAMYVIYLIHACGIGNNKTDFTANQFLTAFGYSTKAHNYKQKLCDYNKLLVDKGFISIKQWKDDNQRQRNTYSMRDDDYLGTHKTVLGTSPVGD